MIVIYSKTALNYLQKLDRKTKQGVFEAINRLVSAKLTGP